MDDKLLRRAGLDYHEYAAVRRHASWRPARGRASPIRALFAFTTHGYAARAQWLQPGDWLVFGSETAGLRAALRDSFAPAQRLRLPMRPGHAA